MYRMLVFPALSRLDAESVHERVLTILQYVGRSTTTRWLLRRLFSYQHRSLEVNLAGLPPFANPLGVAAGFDKNGVAFNALACLGFGHVEVGTVTPFPQTGNTRPRVFRLLPDYSLINRMGFNGAGASVVRANLKRGRLSDFPLGVNIGANKKAVESGHAIDYYAAAAKMLGPYADYITINVSSPNTTGLRDLQAKESLSVLLTKVQGEVDRLPVQMPLLVKVSPDLYWGQLDDVLDVVVSHNAHGIIATNTTVGRPPTLRSPNQHEGGGLSGKPLFTRSTDMIRYIYRHTEGRLLVVGVGGVFTWPDALEKIRAGASLVQTYTGFIYEGPSMARRINKGLADFLVREGIPSIQELIGSDA